MREIYRDINNNPVPVDIGSIPILQYDDFYELVSGIRDDQSKHCLAYFCVEEPEGLRFYCFIADDTANGVSILSHRTVHGTRELRSLTPVVPGLHIFEREIYETFGVEFPGHPWLKPVRYPYDRLDRSKVMDNYPFYEIDSEELHEVGVGPVHAGVIEPGHFRFICNGEKVLHLEIQLGYQHRGTEKLLLRKDAPLQRCTLSENIAGDTAVGHSIAHAQLIESLAGIEVSESLQIERCIALEMERIAVHIGDTAALCGDVAYQLGQVACEALRTTVINTTQLWCGNRFGKGLIRPGGSNFPLDDIKAEAILKMLSDTGKRFGEAADLIYSLPSVLSRFEDIGIVTESQARAIGAVGMAARTSGISRDIRSSHPFQYFRKYAIKPVIQNTGDVLARGLLRIAEVRESIKIISDLIYIWKEKGGKVPRPDYNYRLKPDAVGISLSEGWRGEILHAAFTDHEGRMSFYKVKDPSVHNWMALALAVRNQEISDFPVCNKSFNLSYCGHDL